MSLFPFGFRQEATPPRPRTGRSRAGRPCSRGASSSSAPRWTVESLEDRRLLSGTDWGDLSSRVQIQGYVGWGDSQDAYSFEIESGRQVNLALSGLSGDADLYLVNSEGETVAQSRGSGSRNERIQAQLAPGIYHAVVQRYGFDSTLYRLVAQSTAVAPPADSAGNQFSSARVLGLLKETTSISETVGSQDSADLYQFRVESGMQVQLGLSGLSADANLFLFSSDQRTVARSLRSGTSDEGINVTLTVGTYYVGVYANQDVVSTPYQLKLQPMAPVSTTPKPSQPVTNPPVSSRPVTNPTAPLPGVQPSTPVVANPTSPTAGTPLADVPYYGGTQEWNVNSVHAPEAWARGYTGQGVVVAVVDTGVQLDHGDLRDQLWQNVDEVLGDGIDNDRNGYVDDRFGWDFVNSDNQPADVNGHGTHVAGTIAAARNGVGATGVAYGALIMPVRVLDQSGSGSSRGVAQGIRYAVDNGADIINLSLGGSFSVDIQSAIQYASQKDVLIVAASGNESSSVPSYPAQHSAALANVISVGAYSSGNQRATFSNRVGNSGAVQVDAPGVSIYSTMQNSRYGTMNGTSMATPHVAGVAALILSSNPQLTSPELRRLLTGGSDRNGIAGSDSLGRIDAASSIGRAIA